MFLLFSSLLVFLPLCKSVQIMTISKELKIKLNTEKNSSFTHNIQIKV